MSRADKIRQVAQQAHDNGDCECDTTISRTAEFEAVERSSVTNRSRRGGVQSVATDQKGRGAMICTCDGCKKLWAEEAELQRNKPVTITITREQAEEALDLALAAIDGWEADRAGCQADHDEFDADRQLFRDIFGPALEGR